MIKHLPYKDTFF